MLSFVKQSVGVSAGTVEEEMVFKLKTLSEFLMLFLALFNLDLKLEIEFSFFLFVNGKSQKTPESLCFVFNFVLLSQVEFDLKLNIFLTFFFFSFKKTSLSITRLFDFNFLS